MTIQLNNLTRPCEFSKFRVGLESIIMEDSFRHKGLRKKLVDELREKGISNNNVLDAINQVPRHFFMESSFIELSYRDKAFPIDAGQTISQPYTVAFQTFLLDVKRHDRILEIGTGSGYQTAILAELGAKIFTIERQHELFLKTQAFLPTLGYKVHFVYGDGYEGLPSYAPFDKILITAATPEVPKTLLDQLKIGGKLVAPVGNENIQLMTVVTRKSESEFVHSSHGSFIFVPMLHGKANSK
jgi:protein-L-isoaspartate(D-aspartate) O-methyltransferase